MKNLILIISVFSVKFCFAQQLAGSYKPYYYYSQKDGERPITKGNIELSYGNLYVLDFKITQSENSLVIDKKDSLFYTRGKEYGNISLMDGKFIGKLENGFSVLQGDSHVKIKTKTFVLKVKVELKVLSNGDLEIKWINLDAPDYYTIGKYKKLN